VDRRAGSRDKSEASLAAYSGGTVRAFHPLRVAAGASVELCIRLYQIASDACFSYDTTIMSGGPEPHGPETPGVILGILLEPIELEPIEADVVMRMKQDCA
jgi:hypothetical protein